MAGLAGAAKGHGGWRRGVAPVRAEWRGGAGAVARPRDRGRDGGGRGHGRGGRSRRSVGSRRAGRWSRGAVSAVAGVTRGEPRRGQRHGAGEAKRAAAGHGRRAPVACPGQGGAVARAGHEGHGGRRRDERSGRTRPRLKIQRMGEAGAYSSGGDSEDDGVPSSVERAASPEVNDSDRGVGVMRLGEGKSSAVSVAVGDDGSGRNDDEGARVLSGSGEGRASLVCSL
nr:spidroin-1-like [Aegilops tauschii subsp. strangulata]